PRQLVGVANRPARTVGQGLETVFLIALEDLVAGLARNAERATDLAHRFAVQQLSDKPQALVHYRTLLPRHPHLPQKGESCYPCVRYDLSPMSRAAHSCEPDFRGASIRSSAISSSHQELTADGGPRVRIHLPPA